MTDTSTRQQPATQPKFVPAPTDEKLATRTNQDWTKPGPGTWEVDRSHFTADTSRLIRDVAEYGFAAGFTEGFDMTGAPAKGLDIRFVNGHMYSCLLPLVGGGKDMPLPPNPVLWLVTRLHPAFRKRNREAQAAMDGRIYLDEHRRWEAEWKPYLLETNRAFGLVQPADLSDTQLAEHVDDLYKHMLWGSYMHFRLHVSDLGPIARMLLKTEEFSLDPAEVMLMLAGASPSTSAPAESLGRIREQLAEAAVEPTSLADVRAASAGAAEALDQYLLEYGDRLTTGYDIRARTLAEMPGVILAGLQAPMEDMAFDGGGANAQERGRAAMEGIQRGVPQAERAEFDELLEDARLLYGLRDENGPLTWEWPAGLMRKAVVEVAQRLVAAGQLDEAEHVFDLSAAEMVTKLSGASEPSNAELAERCEHRLSWSAMEAPQVLGKPQDPPPAWVMPKALGEYLLGINLAMALLDPNQANAAMTGVGVGEQSYTGRARVVSSADDALERIEPGDILVAPFTVPTYNTVLAVAGAIVVEHGGILCHAAVIAREYGIPGLVGATGVTSTIPDGATVTVDPAAGTVTVV